MFRSSIFGFVVSGPVRTASESSPSLSSEAASPAAGLGSTEPAVAASCPTTIAVACAGRGGAFGRCARTREETRGDGCRFQPSHRRSVPAKSTDTPAALPKPHPPKVEARPSPGPAAAACVWCARCYLGEIAARAVQRHRQARGRRRRSARCAIGRGCDARLGRGASCPHRAERPTSALLREDPPLEGGLRTRPERSGRG